MKQQKLSKIDIQCERARLEAQQREIEYRIFKSVFRKWLEEIIADTNYHWSYRI